MKFQWTQKHDENPVQIGSKFPGGTNRKRASLRVVRNEAGDELHECKTLDEARQWCFDNGCRPIKSSWRKYHFGPAATCGVLAA